MGFSVVAASAIFFSAALVFSIVLYDTLDSSLHELQEAQEEKDTLREQRLNTRICITEAMLDHDTLTINATNEGSSVIVIRKENTFMLDILLNGTLLTDRLLSYKVEQRDTTIWAPGEKISIYLMDVEVGGGTSIMLITPEGEMSGFTILGPLRARYDIAGKDRPYLLDEDTIYIFDASTSTISGRKVEYFWEFGDGSSGYGERVEHLFSSPGVYFPVLRITDPSATAGEYETRVEVTDITPPGASILAEPVVDEDTPVKIVSIDFDNVGVISWDWDFGDGYTDQGPAVEHTFEFPGYYSISLTVRDGTGNDFTAYSGIMVSDRTSPVAIADEDIIVKVNETAYFNGSASYDPEDGEILSYTWDFGDGHFGSGEYTSHFFSSPGNYSVTLEIKDMNGNTSRDRLTVEVKAGSGRYRNG